MVHASNFNRLWQKVTSTSVHKQTLAKGNNVAAGHKDNLEAGIMDRLFYPQFTSSILSANPGCLWTLFNQFLPHQYV